MQNASVLAVVVVVVVVVFSESSFSAHNTLTLEFTLNRSINRFVYPTRFPPRVMEGQASLMDVLLDELISQRFLTECM